LLQPWNGVGEGVLDPGQGLKVWHVSSALHPAFAHDDFIVLLLPELDREVLSLSDWVVECGFNL
jgi:hypothetical protein